MASRPGLATHLAGRPLHHDEPALTEALPAAVDRLIQGLSDVDRAVPGWKPAGEPHVFVFDADEWGGVQRAACGVRLPAGPGYLKLGTDLPAVAADLSEWRDLCPAALSEPAAARGGLALVGEDGGHGLVVTTYVAHLPEGRRTNAGETVHDLIVWGPDTRLGD